MRSSWSELVLRLLKVPAAPQPPMHGGEVRIFRAAPNYWKLSFVKWVLAQVSAIIGLVVSFFFISFAMVESFPKLALWMEIAEWLGVVAFVLQLPVTFAMLRLDFELRWYIVTDRSLRIREGLLRVDEKTMTFANIQNLSIRRGPLQRLLGIADVEVRSAGGGSGGAESKQQGEKRHELHVGYFRGVANAEEIRDALREGVRRHRDSGLGDPDDVRLQTSAVSPSELDAARELLRESRLLREALTG